MNCFISHKWENWSEIKIGMIVEEILYNGSKNINHSLIQDRKCTKCGKFDWRRV